MYLVYAKNEVGGMFNTFEAANECAKNLQEQLLSEKRDVLVEIRKLTDDEIPYYEELYFKDEF